MPRIIRPEPGLPMTVTIATRVFGSEALIALIRHFHTRPGSQKEACEALGLPNQWVSTNTRLLVQCGVLVVERTPSGHREGLYVVDEYRVKDLAASLLKYSLNDD